MYAFRSYDFTSIRMHRRKNRTFSIFINMFQFSRFEHFYCMGSRATACDPANLESPTCLKHEIKPRERQITRSLQSTMGTPCWVQTLSIEADGLDESRKHTQAPSVASPLNSHDPDDHCDDKNKICLGEHFEQG